MELYILRHGIAEDASSTGRDEDRKLTTDGRKKLREVLKAASRAGVQPSLVLTSPYVRALETSRIAAEELAYSGDLIKTAALTPDGRPEDIWTEVRTHREAPQLLLSSHNPLCATLAGYLLASPNLRVDFKKGAVLRIDFDHFGAQPQGVLRWMLVPRLAGA
jgi:phosphohistidine phosphatase